MTKEARGTLVALRLNELEAAMLDVVSEDMAPEGKKPNRSVAIRQMIRAEHERMERRKKRAAGN